MRKAILSIFAGSMVSMFAAVGAQASVIIIDPNIVATATGSSGSSVATVSAANLVNSVGLTSTYGTPGTSMNYDSSLLPSAAAPDIANPSTYGYRNDSQKIPVTFTFTLDQKYNITGLQAWNYQELYQGTWYNGRGFEGMSVYYSTDGGTNYLSAGNIVLPEAPQQTSGYTGNSVDFGTTLVGVNAIELVGNTNYNNGGTYYGLNEVRFFGTTSVPEPAPAGIMLVAGALLARRRGH